MGVDPGTASTGFGVLRKEGPRIHAVDFGVIHTSPDDTPPVRLMAIADAFEALILRYRPDTLATERLFFAKNQTTAFGVGRTIGVILLLAARHGIEWTEYSPPQVKMAVVGYGKAEKQQVQYMIQRILGLEQPPRPDDAADALAVAVCHAHSLGPEPTGP